MKKQIKMHSYSLAFYLYYMHAFLIKGEKMRGHYYRYIIKSNISKTISLFKGPIKLKHNFVCK